MENIKPVMDGYSVSSVRVIDSSSLTKYVNREDGWRSMEKYLMEGCITLSLAVKEVSNSVWKRVLKVI